MKRSKNIISSTAVIYDGRIFFHDANRNRFYYAMLDDCKDTREIDVSDEDKSKLATIDAYIRAYRNNDKEINCYKGEYTKWQKK